MRTSYNKKRYGEDIMTNEAEQLYALAYLGSCTVPMNDE